MNISAIVGRLTKDMEFIPYTNQKTGKTGYKARGTVAVDRKGTGRNGEKETDFIPVQSWITDAQKEKYHGLYMKKGVSVSVNGVIRVEQYQDKETQQNRTFTVLQGDIQVISGTSSNTMKGQDNSQSGTPQFEPQFDAPGGFDAVYDDEIPF